MSNRQYRAPVIKQAIFTGFPSRGGPAPCARARTARYRRTARPCSRNRAALFTGIGYRIREKKMLINAGQPICWTEIKRIRRETIYDNCCHTSPCLPGRRMLPRCNHRPVNRMEIFHNRMEPRHARRPGEGGARSTTTANGACSPPSPRSRPWSGKRTSSGSARPSSCRNRSAARTWRSTWAGSGTRNTPT